MKAAFIIAIACCIFSVLSGGVYAQGIGKVNVMYDPTFWRSELHLQFDQLAKIQRINGEFYRDIQNAVTVSHTPAELRELSVTLVEDRSAKIWTVLSHRQKLKWRKITNTYGDKDGRTSLLWHMQNDPSHYALSLMRNNYLFQNEADSLDSVVP